MTLCDPMDCSPPGSSVNGILQARILEWVAVSSSRGPFWPRDWTQVSCTAGRFFTNAKKLFTKKNSSFNSYNILPTELEIIPLFQRLGDWHLNQPHVHFPHALNGRTRIRSQAGLASKLTLYHLALQRNPGWGSENSKHGGLKARSWWEGKIQIQTVGGPVYWTEKAVLVRKAILAASRCFLPLYFC